MEATFYLVMKIRRRKWSGIAMGISARKISKRRPTITDDSVVLRVNVDVPYEYLKLRDDDAEIRIPVEATVLSCEVVNYSGLGIKP